MTVTLEPGKYRNISVSHQQIFSLHAWGYARLCLHVVQLGVSEDAPRSLVYPFACPPSLSISRTTLARRINESSASFGSGASVITAELGRQAGCFYRAVDGRPRLKNRAFHCLVVSISA